MQRWRRWQFCEEGYQGGHGAYSSTDAAASHWRVTPAAAAAAGVAVAEKGTRGSGRQGNCRTSSVYKSFIMRWRSGEEEFAG